MDIRIHHSGSRGNLIQVDNILIDPGVPIKRIKEALNYRLRNIEFCLCSHSHADHSKGAKDLLKAGVDLYCSKDTAQTINLTGHRLHIIEPDKRFHVEGWTIYPFHMKHDVPNIGFYIAKDSKRILYATDTNYIHNRFRGLTHILLGVSYDTEILKDNIVSGKIDPALGQRILKNHMSLATAIGFFKANDLSKLEEVYLLHLSDMNSNAEMFKTEIQKITGVPVYM